MVAAGSLEVLAASHLVELHLLQHLLYLQLHLLHLLHQQRLLTPACGCSWCCLLHVCPPSSCYPLLNSSRCSCSP
jgi:hypothetical protein